MKKRKQCGICCIETKWEDERVSVIPPLRTLSALHKVPFESEQVSLSDDFARLLSKWTELSSDYGILYISSHGFPGGIALHDDDAFRAYVRLPQIADALEQAGISNEGCLIHFGSCSTLRTSARDFDDFRNRTGFDAVSGYRHDAWWVKSLAFDLLYLDHLLTYLDQNRPHKPTAEHMEAVRWDLRERAWYALGDSLGFDIQTSQR